MRIYTRLSLVGCVWAGLVLASSLVLAGPYERDGEITTISDNPDNFAAGGWISITVEQPAPDPLVDAASSIEWIEDDGANWNFNEVSLNAKGGITALVAKDVSIKLGYGGLESEHRVDPHDDPPTRDINELPDIESPVKDLLLGNRDVYSAWDENTHDCSLGYHKDFYTVGGTVSYTAGGCCGRVISTLATDDAWVRAGHGKKPSRGPMDPPRQFVPALFSSALRFDAELGLLTILPAQVSGGVSPDDPLSNASTQEMTFQLEGQDESGAWRFSGGHFALSTPGQEIIIEGEIDDLHVYEIGWGDSYGVLNRGGAVDGSQGTSPWMNQLNAALAGQAETGVPGTTYGAPAIWLNPVVDLVQATAGFTVSADCIPVEMSLAPSLLEMEEHGLSGDSNGDGSVDAADYVGLRKIGMTPEGHTAWRTNFGETAGLGSPLASPAHNVPEPAGALLLLFAAALGAWRRRSVSATVIH